jgi:hypothetical protein
MRPAARVPRYEAAGESVAALVATNTVGAVMGLGGWLKPRFIATEP